MKRNALAQDKLASWKVYRRRNVVCYPGVALVAARTGLKTLHYKFGRAAPGGCALGNEANCVARFGKQQSKGEALLETNELIFRGQFRLKVPFASLKSAKEVDGKLRLETPDGPAVFELGEKAAKWCDKILHPKSRIEKLGVKPDAAVALFAELEREFLAELGGQTKNIAKGKLSAETEWIFLAAETKEELARIAKLAKTMPASATIWVVYPKGRKELTENDVLAAGRKAGLKDVKVVGFSATHTGLKFVVPLGKR